MVGRHHYYLLHLSQGCDLGPKAGSIDAVIVGG
jgi:hypothetical protein